MKKLYRSRHDRRIRGVCGGLANFLGVGPTLIRVIAVIMPVRHGIFRLYGHGHHCSVGRSCERKIII
jgi:phage shock protein C